MLQCKIGGSPSGSAAQASANRHRKPKWYGPQRAFSMCGAIVWTVDLGCQPRIDAFFRVKQGLNVCQTIGEGAFRRRNSGLRPGGPRLAKGPIPRSASVFRPKRASIPPQSPPDLWRCDHGRAAEDAQPVSTPHQTSVRAQGGEADIGALGLKATAASLKLLAGQASSTPGQRFRSGRSQRTPPRVLGRRRLDVRQKPPPQSPGEPARVRTVRADALATRHRDQGRAIARQQEPSSPLSLRLKA
jgi:hypothetical protein